MKYLQLFLLVFINSVVGEFLQISSAPINMTRVIRNISAMTYTACHMECKKEGECKSIAVTEGSVNQLPTCHLLKKDDGNNKGGHIMTTLQAMGSEPRGNGTQCNSPRPKDEGDNCKGVAKITVSCKKQMLPEEKPVSLIDGPMIIKKGNHIATLSQISMEYEIRFKLKVDLSKMDKFHYFHNVLQISKGCSFNEKGCKQPAVYIYRRSSTECDLLFQTWRDGALKSVRFIKENQFFDNPVDLTLRQRKTSNGDYHQQVYANGELLSDFKNSTPLSFSEMKVYVAFTDTSYLAPPNGQLLQFIIKGATGIKRIKH